ncbi:phage head morphogenesis protein [Pseudomonas sp. MPR-ANC1]|uniref:phage minor head protein n=1 Tax=Pseudomonas sp. MPR-ANC1 TaxID=2075548 RepID=UPI000CD2FE0A|nr:phage minor head protein [Pseudomonas sp. MPR-ANC1]POA50300.1 phage head morphogenesis protein [Pseudomonas sp. MPR-ANC1]
MSNEGYLTDATTRHQVYVQRYAGGNMKRVAVFISKAIRTAKARVAEGLSSYGTRRYISQIETLQGDLRSIYDDMKGRTQLDLSEFAVYEAAFNAKLLGTAIKAIVQLNAPAAEMVAASALADPMLLEARKGVQRISIAGALDQFGTKKAAEIISEIQIGSSIGETSQQIAKRLTSIHQLHRDQADSLVRTITNHVASSARMATLNANADIIEGKRRIATLDGRTSPFCRSVDNQIVPLDAPSPPFHWRCRTSEIPVIKAEYRREISGSTRPSVGAEGIQQVSSNVTYQEWLSRQPASFQRDALGPGRYALFSKGDLQLDKFVDDSGKTLTLKELRDREPMAFERANR